jgi:hypothetical protein
MSSCQIGYTTLGSVEVAPCGKRAVANCADCGVAICSDCRSECCGDSFCSHCYDYHAAHSCVKKPVQNESDPLSSARLSSTKRVFLG